MFSCGCCLNFVWFHSGACTSCSALYQSLAAGKITVRVRIIYSKNLQSRAGARMLSWAGVCSHWSEETTAHTNSFPSPHSNGFLKALQQTTERQNCGRQMTGNALKHTLSWTVTLAGPRSRVTVRAPQGHRGTREGDSSCC